MQSQLCLKAIHASYPALGWQQMPLTLRMKCTHTSNKNNTRKVLKYFEPIYHNFIIVTHFQVFQDFPFKPLVNLLRLKPFAY